MDKWKENFNLGVTRNGIIKTWVHTFEKTEHQYWTDTDRDTFLIKMVFGMTCRLMLNKIYDRCLQRLHAGVSKAFLTYALTLMNKIGRWNDEKWIGPKFVACVRICSKQYEPTKVLMDRFWTWILYKEQLVNVKLEWLFVGTCRGSRTPTLLERKWDMRAVKYEIEVLFSTPVETFCSWKDKRRDQTKTSIMVRKMCVKMKLSSVYEKMWKICSASWCGSAIKKMRWLFSESVSMEEYAIVVCLTHKNERKPRKLLHMKAQVVVGIIERTCGTDMMVTCKYKFTIHILTKMKLPTKHRQEL